MTFGRVLGVVALISGAGILSWSGERIGLYSTWVGEVLLTLAAIVGALFMIAWTSRSLRASEQRAHEAEERFRGAFESAAIGIGLVSPEGHWIAVNRALCEIVGYDEDKLLELSFQDITHPDDLAADVEQARRVLDGELQTYRMEKRYVHRAGHVVWVLLSVSLVRDASGRPLYFVSQVEDVTERKLSEDALRESRAMLAEAQRLASLGSWRWDAGADVITWSDELYRLMGLEPQSVELTHSTYLDLVHPDDRETLEQTVGRALEHGEPYEIEHRIVRPDGVVAWLHGRGRVASTADGSVVLEGTAQDVTVRREAEERVAAAERRFRTLVEQLPLTTYVRPLDMTTGNVYASPQVEAMTGVSVEQWQNDPHALEKAVHPDDVARVLAGARRLRETGEPFRGEYRYLKPDGSIVWVQDETYLVAGRPGSNDGYVQGFLLDITERKQAEADRERLEAELRHSQKLDAIGQLAGGVAHDFNNLLTAVTGYSELLIEELVPGSEPRAHAEEIRRAAAQAGSLTRKLLAFGRKQLLHPAVLEINDVVAAAGGLLRNLIGERYRLRLDCADGAGMVLADAGQLEHVLVNLVLNARDAMPDGGTITIETRPASLGPDESLPAGSYAVVRVIDSGYGMDEATQARVFEPFFTTKADGGSGLGLSTAHGIATQSGGTITVTSTPGEGSVFELWLPRTPTVHAVAEPEQAAPAEMRRPATVLVAEDRKLVRALVVTVLQRLGLTVLAAADGEEALALAAGHAGPIDLLVTDVVMPGLGGDELAEQLLAARPGLHVLYMSGYTEREAIRRGAAEGGVAFIEKPFKTTELAERVLGLLADVPASASAQSL